ncbi:MULTISPECIES: DUF2267 domain-containing protein [Sinorhizobium]|uniref:DUF2267 domain-containing protein n=1 Tax=Sinorhizobium TaxID=28105 RepID=UPI001F3EAF35|nr:MULTISPECIES: DUF2267 domain-containing protein [Sinorhizobium]
MSASGVAVFDKTLQITNVRLYEIMEHQGPDRQRAWHILSAVLHSVRDRLPSDLAARLSAQLPSLVRGAYYDQCEPSKRPAHQRRVENVAAMALLWAGRAQLQIRSHTWAEEGPRFGHVGHLRGEQGRASERFNYAGMVETTHRHTSRDQINLC